DRVTDGGAAILRARDHAVLPAWLVFGDSWREVVGVTVAAHDRHGVRRAEHTRSGNEARVDRVSERDVAEAPRSDVAHRGEAGFERGFRRVHAANRLVGRGLHDRVQVPSLVDDEREMRVAVDEARGHRVGAEVDDVGAGGSVAGGHLSDATVLHANRDVASRLAAPTVDQSANTDKSFLGGHREWLLGGWRESETRISGNRFQFFPARVRRRWQRALRRWSDS